MEILLLCVLGLVQGLCEFLPVSSSGHLVLLSALFGIEDSLFVSIILHVATLFAVVVVFRKDIWHIIKHPLSKESMLLLLATIPTCIIVLLLMPLVEKSFSGGGLALCFALSGFLLLFTSRTQYPCQSTFGKKQAISMGIMQGLAIFPGLSRSGCSICGGLLAGARREEAAKFSFLMSLPIILVSLFGEVVKLVQEGTAVSVSTPGLLLSSLIAFLVGIISIKLMMRLTKRLNFKWFSFYLFAMSILSWIVL